MTISRNWAHLRSFLRKYWNREILEWFRDIDPTELPDNFTSRKSARAACLIRPDDDKLTVHLKIDTFRELRSRIDRLPMVAGIPFEDLDREIKYRPKVSMFFAQDMMATPDYQDPETGIVSFRLMDKEPDTITRTEIKALAKRIDLEFSKPNGYIWKKGKNMMSCRNQRVGLPQKLLCFDKAEGMEMYRAIARVMQIELDEDLLKYGEPERQSVTNPTGYIMRLGRRVKKKKWRPIVNVRFQYATLRIHGLVQPLVLVDRGHYFRQAIEDGSG